MAIAIAMTEGTVKKYFQIRSRSATRHYRTLLSGAFTRTNALLEELALHGIAREGERCSEVLARDFISPAVKFELAERSVEERVGGEAIAVGDGANLFEPAFGAFVLRDGDGAVQPNDRGRTYRHQRVVKVKRSFPSQCPQCDGPSCEPMRWRPPRDTGSTRGPLPRGRGTFALRLQAVNPIGIDPGRRARSGCPMRRHALASAPRAGT